MIVIRIDDEETKLTKLMQQKIAILKLTENGRYIEGVGIKDNEFFLITEDDSDEMYLSYKNAGGALIGSRTREDVIKMLLFMMKEQYINREKAKIKGEEPPEWWKIK